MITVSKGKRNEGMSYHTLLIKKDGKMTCIGQTNTPQRIFRGRQS